MMFLQFVISDAYLKEFAENDEPTASLNVHATRWFDLKDRGDRCKVVRNLSGLVARGLDEGDD